jgi:hypothetical protein
VGRVVRWVVGVLSALAVWRLWSRRRREAPPVEPQPDPAEELRRKLADARTEEPETVTAPEPEEPVETLEERRARVHAKAQEAMDAMREDDV